MSPRLKEVVMRHVVKTGTLVIDSMDQAVKLGHLVKEYLRAYRAFMAKVVKEGGRIDLVQFGRKYLPLAMQALDLGKGHLRCAMKHAVDDYRAQRQHGLPSYAKVPPSRYYIAPCKDGRWVVVLQWCKGGKRVTVALDGDNSKYPWLDDLFGKGCQRGDLYVSQASDGEWMMGVDLFYDD
jgi:hypothetical protein